MSIVLHVDGPRWRAHLDRTLATQTGLVPVVKGNGYGFGSGLLTAESERLAGHAGVDLLAVGTYREATAALAGFSADVLVLEPYRPSLHGGLAVLAEPALVHTVTASADVHDLHTRVPNARVVAEGLTSMNRHGAHVDDYADLLAAAGAGLLGGTLHLPLGSGHLTEVSEWLTQFPAIGTWLLSHVSSAELGRLRTAYPGVTLRPRVGTALWLGEPTALTVRADVLDVRPVAAGNRAGYRGRSMGAGHLVVVSGGTAHGVAMDSPSSVATLRQRAIVLAEGALEAAGRVRSPFSLRHSGGDPDAAAPLWFVEPPHMQVSLVHVPRGTAPPAIGDQLDVRVRLTTFWADDVVLSSPDSRH